ncbi:hypothetical protein WJ542_07285 [Paraburkholderia sp. B3]|uniref:hypothetical protein n=1 Tax=Paraburkholderia sp. B3 TaxID=3134791 RepID=UPI003982704B
MALEGFSREQFLSLLEKATKPQFFLLSASFLLFADAALSYFSGFGVRDAIGGSDVFGAALALKILLIFIAFSGVANLVIPTAMAVFI